MQQLTQLPDTWVISGVVGLGAIFVFASLCYRWCLPLSFLVFGIVWSVFRAGEVLKEPLPEYLEREEVQVTGTVSGLPESYDEAVRFLFDVESLRHQWQVIPFNGRIRLKWYENAPRIKPGDRWRLTVRLRRPRGFQNPGGFDYEAWLFQQRIRASGYVRTHQANAKINSSSWPHAIHLVRAKVLRALHDQIESRSAGALLAALTIGYRADMSPEQWEILRRTGTIHLMAISGLHIGLMFAIGYFIASFVWRRLERTVLFMPAQKAACVFGLMLAAIYAALAGFSIPTQRALIMLSVLVAGCLLERRLFSFNTVALALLVVLIVDPLSVLSAGFWLSFFAVAVIVFSLNMHSTPASTREQDRAVATHAMYRIRQWGWMQLAISFGMAPLVLLWFQQVSLIAPLANLVAIPFVGFAVVPLALCGVLFELSGIHTASAWLFKFCALLLNFFETLLAQASGWSWSVIVLKTPDMLILLLTVAGGVVILFSKALPQRWLGVFFIAPLLWPAYAGPKENGLSLIMLDVGQGLALVVRQNNKTLLFDTGARFGPRFDVGEAVVTPYLRSQGVSKLDVLVVSHNDIDHAGGANAILRNFPVGVIYSSNGSNIDSANYCGRDVAWQWQNVEFRFLTVPDNVAEKDNDLSCVLSISSDQHTLLLAADIESTAESWLITNDHSRLRADVLVAPHHGSRSSSTEAFVRAVKPEFTLVSAGYKNRFGHPHKGVIDRYLANGVQTFNTAIDGAVMINFSQAGVQIAKQRMRHQRYWHSL